ncbi:MAG: MarR family transcriptional regulator [Acidobacteriaceae bacterium]|nr:MarR family transcriptional regulator [Acidobacteriaceae bacterium]MBV9746303.1 MarR family transcriptional regulator [Terriglobia bacterium]
MRPIKIHLEQAEAFFARGRRGAQLADECKPIPFSRVVAFEDAEDLPAVLTPRRVLLLKTLKDSPGSIAELARKLKRHRSAVTRDVQVLEQLGLLIKPTFVNGCMKSAA